MFVLQLYQIVFVIFIIIVIGGLVGFKFAETIHHPTLYLIFWLMWSITFLTIISLITSVLVYDNIQHKEGPIGDRGENGSKGEAGEPGICKSDCRDGMCYKELLYTCNQYVNTKEPNAPKPINISNQYFKSRIANLCRAKEFNNLMAVKGREDVIRYLEKILKVWIDLLYKEGGRIYFESTGQENEFNWRKKNPWDEIKKYDVYYWGMPDDAKIVQKKRCNGKKAPPKPKPVPPRLRTMVTNDYEFIWEDHNSHKKRNRDPSQNTFWRPKPHKLQDDTYYPVGDTVFKYYRKEGECRGGNKEAGKFQIEGGANCTGPNEATILVSDRGTKPPMRAEYLGDMKYKYCKNWLCRLFGLSFSSKTRGVAKTRSHEGHLHRLIPHPGYVCLGDVIAPEGESIDVNKYRCVPEDCVEHKSHLKPSNFVNSSETSMVVHKVGNDSKESYNLFVVSSDDKRMTKGMYNFTGKCQKPSADNHPRFTPEIEDEDPTKDHQHSLGWHTQKPIANKYSVLQFMELPETAILVNKADPKISLSIRHIVGTHYNSYHILKPGTEDNQSFDTLLEAVSQSGVQWSKDNEPKKDSYKWKIDINQNKYGDLTILSVRHNKYLKGVRRSQFQLVFGNDSSRNIYWRMA